MKKIVFTFGRMNPPTIGHAKLVDKVQSVAKSEKADARVYLSHTQNAKKDPLSYKEKIRLAKKAFGSIMQESNSKTLIQILKELEQDGYTDVVAVFGGDRIKEMETLIKKYNGKDYNFDTIKVVSAGERDADSTDPNIKKKKKHVTKVSEMSASAMRELAKEGQIDDYEEDGKKYIGFRKGLPKNLQRDAESIAKAVVANLSEEVEMEEQRAPLTIAQRQAKARQMKRLAPRLARFRKMKAKRMADREQILKRAQKAARNVIRKKVAGERGADYSALSASEKITIDKLVAKKSAVIQKLAKKLLPKVRKAEIERLKQARSAKNEEFEIDINALFEAKVAQDPEIKGREGTQPKKYHSGLAKSTKAKRDAEFKKGAEKHHSDPSAYPDDHAGDSGEKTKTSKYTKKYHQMFGEGAVEDTRERHKEEKEEMKARHDREMDAARLQDTREKNQQTEEFELSEDATAALKKKADKSGIPLGILRQVYNRGMAAWRTGHRPGATQQQWAFARVNSFITGGKTRTTADADLWAKAKGRKAKKESVEEACWDGYKQVGMKKKGDKMVPDCVPEASSPAQQAAIAISMKKAGKKPKNEEQFEPHMMYDPESGDKELAKVPADHERLAKKGWKHEPPKKKKLKAMLAVPSARPPSQMGEGKELDEFGDHSTRISNAKRAIGRGMNRAAAMAKYKVSSRDLDEPQGSSLFPKSVIAREEAELEEMPRWLLEPLSKITNKKGYDAAKKILKVVLDRKKKEGKLAHSIEYYAQQIAKQFQGVDARVLADMMSEESQKMDPPEIGTDKTRKRFSDMTPGQIDESFQTAKSAGTGHTMFASEFMKIQGSYEHHPDVIAQMEEQEACCEECEEHFDHIVEAAEYQGRKVKLNDPFRLPAGSTKKFGVYVKNDKGNVVKVTFGDPNMEIKRDDPERRKNFRARHGCDDPGPKWKARYWSCYQWRASAKVDN